MASTAAEHPSAGIPAATRPEPWPAPPGGQPCHADLAVERVLTLRFVFRLALRQAEGFARSVLKLPGLDRAVPDHATLSRRGQAFAKRQPRATPDDGPLHLALDSMGLELFSQGAWCAEKHARLRRRWLELRIGVDAAAGEIAAPVLTDGDEDDAAHVPDLRRPCMGAVASLTADGACDRDPIHQAAAAQQRGSPLEVAIPRPGPTPCWAPPIPTGRPRATVTSSSWPSGAASVGSARPATAGATMRKPP